jgi:hypothetical protein
VTVDPEAYRAAVRRAFVRALALHGGEEVADVDEGVDPGNGVWGIDVTPKKLGAAPVYVAHPGGDEVTLGFGETHVYLWDDHLTALADEVERILVGVCAGRFAEAGRLGDSFARVNDEDGETIRLGAMSLPIPWTLRRRRRYEPYS